MSTALPIPNLTLIDHPLVQHKLSPLRKRETPTGRFRGVMREISLLEIGRAHV